MDGSFATDPAWRTIWPAYALRVSTPRLVLRALTPADAPAVTALAAAGIHDPATMPFEVPWTDAEPEAMARDAYRFWCGCVGTWTVDSWRLPLVVERHGEIIGVQDVAAEQFPVRRTVVTGSWLGQRHQGQGHGTEMRAAVLHFAFAGLGAERAETGAWADNAASLGVTRRLGYEPEGTAVGVRRGEAAVQRRFALTRSRWEAGRRDDITIEGLDVAAPLFAH